VHGELRSGAVEPVPADRSEADRPHRAEVHGYGVVGVEGTFEKGDVVEIRDGSGRVHGRGLVNYAADACRKLAGRHSDDIDTILGWRGYDALITRDNLVMGAV